MGRYKARTWKEEAVYHGAGGDERYEASYSAAWPDKIRVDTGDYTLIVNGNKGWIRAKDQTRDMTSEELTEHMEGIYVVWVLSLAPLGNNEFKLSPLGDTKVAGRPTTGINVRQRDHRDVEMYFDKRTGLLAMSRTRYKEARSGSEVRQETVFSDYKDDPVIKTPTKVSIKRDGKLVVEAAIDTNYLESLDEGIFGKP